MSPTNLPPRRQRGPAKPTKDQLMPPSAEHRGGAISRLEPDRGFGFIVMDVDGGKQDVFFHATELENAEIDQLAIGDQVQFRVIATPKGTRAVEVRLISAN